jgi:hypothetical protein
MGEGIDKVNGTADKGAEGEPRKKRKKAGSAEDGDESGEKGKRPCDMCRKRKVSRIPSLIVRSDLNFVIFADQVHTARRGR